MNLLHNHPFHMVEKSPWPVIASLNAFLMTTGLASLFHSKNSFILMLGLVSMLMASFQWWRDISRESTHQGLHTMKVQTNLQFGMILFIVSEVMFFFSFFWAFFHSSLVPTDVLGGVWPPILVIPFNPFQIPLLNTAILLSSGVSVTWAHHSLISGNHSQALQGLCLTVFLGFYFTILQLIEYMESSFSIADSVYGATFFVATGFHGLHVIIGSMFLFVCTLRHFMKHFSSNHHFGVEAAIWYWHFVDVVWLFLFVSIYWWGC
uniref:Cytochrome c oxidase subunit 3 n=1 Tax=Halice sp. JL-2018 TaxID=2528348 RepID=A0A3S8IF77_9CRUS|nr:cytochrome c oxidase subunit 3 [Halice sp. JL-2018]